MTVLAFRAEISVADTGSVTYTVPANSRAVFIAFANATNTGIASGGTLTINGVYIASFNSSSTAGAVATPLCLKPLTANAGDVIACTNNDLGTGNSSVVGLIGFLYS